jgi:small subunit ribosomal protein S15
MDKVAETFKNHSKDVGSSALQIISFTKRILSIAEHSKEHKKDKHCRVGIIALVNKRKAMMAHLKKTDNVKYQSLIKELGLRG